MYKSDLDEQWCRNAEIGGAIAEVRKEGWREGWKEGKAQEKRNIIRSLLVMSNLPVGQIATITKAPISLVEEVKKEADIS